MNQHPQAELDQPRRCLRNCIICGSDDAKPVFTYTLDFLLGVRGHREDSLRLQGWTEETGSTIVKCSNCGCNYVRDPFLPSPAYAKAMSAHAETAQSLDERRQRLGSKETYKHYPQFDYQVWVVRNLVLLAARAQKRDIKVLDFGAGGGETASMARMMGVRDVVAYDPNWAEAIQEHFDATNFPGIHCVRSLEPLSALGPFDAVIFQSAVEHVLDPRGELQTIYDLMAPGGYLYVNNPVMEIDKEIGQLRAATTIKKSDRISYYHPGHFNYMMPKDFERLLKEIGYEIMPLVHYAPVPFASGFYREFLLTHLKRGVRYLQNVLGLPYDRYYYIVRKPTRSA